MKMLSPIAAGVLNAWPMLMVTTYRTSLPSECKVAIYAPEHTSHHGKVTVRT
jgi:hypothetical protein